MALTGIGSTYSNVYENRHISSKKEVTETAGKQYTNVKEYYDYLKGKYKCLNDKNYKVTISPAFLEKCIKDPEKAELMEKSLAHLPVDHQNMTAFWSAQGAKVVNEEWIYDENGNCGGSPGMYVTNNNSSSDNSVHDKIPEKKGRRKQPSPQEHYEKRKFLREQFEERLAEKEYLKGQLEEKEMKEELLKKSILAKEQNAGRFVD